MNQGGGQAGGRAQGHGAGAAGGGQQQQPPQMPQDLHGLINLVQELQLQLNQQQQPQGDRRKLPVIQLMKPQDWRTWRDHFESFSRQWDAARKADELKTAFTGDAHAMLEDILRGINTGAVDDAVILVHLNTLQERFLPQAAGPLARSTFTEAKQMASEDKQQWHGRCRQLFGHAYLNEVIDNNIMAIERFVDGLANPHTQTHVAERVLQTYHQALQFAQTGAAVALKYHGKKRGGNGNKVHMLSAIGRNRTGRSGEKECWHCKQPGHVQDECEEFMKQKDYIPDYNWIDELTADLCQVDRKRLYNKLQALSGTSNQYALLDLYGPGHTVTVAGAIAYVTQCAPVEVTLAPYPNCTMEVPVFLNGPTQFADPYTYVLHEYGTKVVCNDIMTISWKINGVWMCALPIVHQCMSPHLPECDPSAQRQLHPAGALQGDRPRHLHAGPVRAESSIPIL